MSERVKSVWAFLAHLFHHHPGLTILLIGLGGGGWYFDRHPEVLASLTTSGLFSAIPNGWIALAVLAQAVGLFSLSRKVAGCELSHAVQAARYEAHLRTLRTGIGRLILLVSESRREEAEAIMRDIDDAISRSDGHAPRSNHLPQGRRWYDGAGA